MPAWLAHHLEHRGAGNGALTLGIDREEAAVERNEGLERPACTTGNLGFVYSIEKVHGFPLLWFLAHRTDADARPGRRVALAQGNKRLKGAAVPLGKSGSPHKSGGRLKTI